MAGQAQPKLDNRGAGAAPATEALHTATPAGPTPASAYANPPPNPVSKTRIEGVHVKDLKWIPDERGRLLEILRNDDPIFQKFGQVYVTSTLPQVVKAWHYHKLQDDYFTCLRGMVKLVIFDNRPDSPTYQHINEYFLGEIRPQVIVVPRLCYHGWKCVSAEEAFILNCVTEPYNHKEPDEFRLDPHQNGVIPYHWQRRDG